MVQRRQSLIGDGMGHVAFAGVALHRPQPAGGAGMTVQLGVLFESSLDLDWAR